MGKLPVSNERRVERQRERFAAACNAAKVAARNAHDQLNKLTLFSMEVLAIEGVSVVTEQVQVVNHVSVGEQRMLVTPIYLRSKVRVRLGRRCTLAEMIAVRDAAKKHGLNCVAPYYESSKRGALTYKVVPEDADEYFGEDDDDDDLD